MRKARKQKAVEGSLTTSKKRRRLETTKNNKGISEGKETGVLPLHVPIRDWRDLYVSRVTLDCALGHQCVPCAYKIGLFDVSLDSEFTKTVPNRRPEQCPRSSRTTSSDGTMGYRQGMAALTVGDGDMSFSLALARILKPGTSSSTVIGTSYEAKDILLKTYPNFKDNIIELESLGAQLFYNIDATRLAETLPASVRDNKFDRICWNFPCTAIANGQDGQNDDMEKNKELVRKFMSCSSQILSQQGEIHICHKTKPPYNQWKLEHVALEGLVPNTVRYLGKVVLDKYLLPPYTPRKALDRKSFPCHDACFFIFGPDQATTSPIKRGTLHPSVQSDGSIQMEDDSLVIHVSEEVILSIRESLMSTASSERTRTIKNKRR